MSLRYKNLILFLFLYILISSSYTKDLISDNILDHYFSKNVPSNFLEKKQLRSHLQEVFIVEYLFPWMDNHSGRFPKRRNFEEGLDTENFSYYKIFGINTSNQFRLGLFDSKKDLITKAIIKAKELDKYHHYTFPSIININSNIENNVHIKYIEKIDQTYLQNPETRKKIQEYFIKNIIFPWILTHDRNFPKVYDYKKTILGLSFVKVFGYQKPNTPKIIGIFDSISDLKARAYELDKDHSIIPIEIDPNNEFQNNPHLIYINSLTSSDLKDPIKKEEIQKYFIENILFPWILAHNGKYPNMSDFKKTIIGVSFSKLFNTKNYKGEYIIGIFNSTLELKSKAYSIAKNTPNLSNDIFFSLNDKMIFSVNLSKLDFTNPKEVYKLQLKFVMMYILPWIDNYKKFPARDNFGTFRTQVGIAYERIFGTVYKEYKKYSPLFKSLTDLKDFIKQQINEKEIDPSYLQYLDPCTNLFNN